MAESSVNKSNLTDTPVCRSVPMITDTIWRPDSFASETKLWVLKITEVTKIQAFNVGGMAFCL